MANITPTISDKGPRTKVVFWEQINEDDEGASIRVPADYADKVVVMQGTFNGGAYTLEFSQDGGTTWFTAKDNLGSNVSFSAVNSAWVASNGEHWRVSNDNNGTAEDVDVYMTCVLGS